MFENSIGGAMNAFWRQAWAEDKAWFRSRFPFFFLIIAFIVGITGVAFCVSAAVSGTLADRFIQLVSGSLFLGVASIVGRIGFAYATRATLVILAVAFVLGAGMTYLLGETEGQVKAFVSLAFLGCGWYLVSRIWGGSYGEANRN